MTKPPVWIRRALKVLAALVLLYLVVWAALPPLLKWQGETRATRALGREVRIGRVDFIPWKLDLSVDDLEIAGIRNAPSRAPEGSATPHAEPPAVPLLTLRRLHIDIAWASFLHRAPVVQALEVDGLRLRFARLAPGHYDVDDLIRQLAPKPEPPRTEPLHFALYNLQLRDAALVFDDLPARRVHALSGLHLAVPFISNFPAQVDIKVEPRLSFVLNGVAFDSGALATPFAKTRSGQVTLKVAGLNVAPYLGYLPDSLPVRIKAGILTTDLAIEFSLPPNSPPALQLHGSVAAVDSELTDSRGAPLLAWRRLDIELRSAAPLARQAAISRLRIEGARLAASRNADGEINLLSLGPRTEMPPAAPASAASAAARSTPSRPDEWHVALDRLTLVDAAASWVDMATTPRAPLRIDGLAADLTQIEWPMVRPFTVDARGSIRTEAASATTPATGAFAIVGSATNRDARLKMSLSSLPLETLAAYLEHSLGPRVIGRLSAEARLDWSASPRASDGPLLTIDAASVDGLAFRERPGADRSGPPAELASLKRLTISDARVDLPTRSVTLGRLVVDGPSMAISRGQDGHWDVERWKPPTAGAPPVAAPSASGPSVEPWRFLLRDAALTGGHLDFADARPAAAALSDPVRVAVDELQVAVQNLAWQGNRPTVPAQIELRGRIGPPHAPGEKVSQSGSFDWRGVVGTAPLLASGGLRVERFPVHLFMRYVGQDLGVRVAHAEFGFAGNLSVRQRTDGLDLDLGADLLLGALRLETVAPAAAGDTLLRWNTLSLKGVRVSVKPGAKPQLDIGKAEVDDFYARLLVTEEGKLNFSSVGGSAPQTDARRTPAAQATNEHAGLPFDFRLDATSLTNGRIDFSDHFIRPNYSTALTDLVGSLGPLRSGSSEMAALSLHGKAAGTALLEVSGSVNPLARPLALDLHARATDLELAPLSPYAGKYAGYAIERGKMSVDVSYRLDPGGRLEAKNQVVLNQLTFGRKIDSPTATQLPVLLAIALLKDRNGVIDLNLPISGSLNDPQFSVASLVGRLLGNLLVKAVTSPFALLTGAGGGGAGTAGDSGRVEFIPGTARLADTGQAAIEKVAEALSGKSNLMLTVTGVVDPAAEEVAYRSAVLAERLDAARKKQTVASAAAASAVAPPLDAAARARGLKELYRENDLADKPRNALGFAKELSGPEMEARLEAAEPVDADMMRALALQRGVSVRDALIARGLPSERLFLAAPQLHSDPSGAAPAAWVPHSQLALSVR